MKLEPPNWLHQEQQLADEITRLRAELAALPARLIAGIEHGDDEHKAWLAEAVTEICSGKFAPPPRGKGKAEAELAQAKADVARLRQALKRCSESPDHPSADVALEALATTAPAPVVPPSTSTYPLFEHMSREHGLTLVESELREIIDAGAKCGAPFAQACDAH